MSPCARRIKDSFPSSSMSIWSRQCAKIALISKFQTPHLLFLADMLQPWKNLFLSQWSKAEPLKIWSNPFEFLSFTLCICSAVLGWSCWGSCRSDRTLGWPALVVEVGRKDGQEWRWHHYQLYQHHSHLTLSVNFSIILRRAFWASFVMASASSRIMSL